MVSSTRPKRRLNKTLVSVLMTVIIPVLVLTRLSGESSLGPSWGLVAALVFPISYGLWEFRINRKLDFYALIGLVGVLLTGGIGLLELPAEWIAIKEAALPAVIGIVVVVSQQTRWPLVTKLLSQIIDLDRIAETAVMTEKSNILATKLKITTYLIAGSFLMSAGLNFILASLIVISQPGTSEFNAELGKLSALSYPIIMVPSLLVLIVAVQYFLHGVHKMTGQEITEFLRT